MGADFEEMIRAAGTSGANYGLDTEGIVAELRRWRELCEFWVKEAEGDRVEVEFVTLPADMEGFVREVYRFCPDVVDQGTGCVGEYVGGMEEGEMPEEMKELVKGVDFEDEGYGLEILKRELERGKRISLWWD